MVALFDLRALRLALGNRGVFQGDQADASAGRLPRHQRERDQMADVDRIVAYLLLRLTAWLNEWEHSFRRLYT